MTLYANAKLKEKSSFRATQCFMWSVLNTGIIISFIVNKEILLPLENWKMFLWGFCLLVCATLIGNKIHTRVSQKVFSIVLYISLIGASGVLFYNNIIK